MNESKSAVTRVRRSTKERVDEIDRKIVFHQKAIKALEEKKQTILTSPINQRTMVNNILAKAEETGMSLNEIAEKLGIEL